MNDVIRATIKAHNKGGPGKIEWRVLVREEINQMNKKRNNQTKKRKIRKFNKTLDNDLSRWSTTSP